MVQDTIKANTGKLFSYFYVIGCTIYAIQTIGHQYIL